MLDAAFSLGYACRNVRVHHSDEDHVFHAFPVIDVHIFGRPATVVEPRHQSMRNFGVQTPWGEAAVLGVARDWALAQLERNGPVAAWVVDDAGMPKKGMHSVGVAKQSSGVLGEQDNCQVAVAVTVARPVLSVSAAYRL